MKFQSSLSLLATVGLFCLRSEASLQSNDHARSHIAARQARHALAERQGAKTYCTPTQSCWPTDAQWSSFNSTVGGKLIKVVPWADPCFTQPNSYKPAECAAIEKVYLDGVSRAGAVGTAQSDNWAYCYSNEGDSDDCSLQAIAPALGTTIPLLRTCKLGRISPYAVAVSNAQQVQDTITFAKKNNVKVVVKNTGHEYQGRATAPDTLMIWTHQLNSLEYRRDYLGSPALVLGSGVLAGDAYTFAAKNGHTVTFGAYGSVGVAGGFAQGGGHGPLGPKYGLAVDNILEFTVVTPDAKVHKVNSLSKGDDADLFWALRGGGGGVWGVVVETIYKLHPPTPVVAAVFNASYNNIFDANKDNATADYLSALASYQLGWTRQGWAGYNFIYSDQISFNQGLPTNDLRAAKASMKGFFDYVQNDKRFKVENATINLYPDFESYRLAVLGNGADNTPVAFSERLASRLIPYSQFASNSSRDALGSSVAKAIRVNQPSGLSLQKVIDLIKKIPVQVYSTGPIPAAFGGPSGRDTGVNTAWRESLWEVVIASGWTYGFPDGLKSVLADATHKAADELRGYGTGTYYSESDVLEDNWQTAFFGNNYQRLIDIKQKVDPDNDFIVWKGIGYEGQENQDAFRCYQKP